jgi:aspartyl-tRNA(Asn)/glutamyl-tRNA(Gln) amidotransferase subunit C
MSVTRDDVRHIARLARLEVGEDRIDTLTAELAAILDHMRVLEGVDASGLDRSAAEESQPTPLRNDNGPPIPLATAVESFAPEMRDGFLLVPRLATHGDETERAP